jgi:uncharacterized protein (DUF697 family)
MTIAELDRIRDQCKTMVTRRALMSAGASVVPVPGADLALDVGILVKLLPEISRRFGLDEKQVAKLDPHKVQQVLVVAKSLGNSVIGRAVTRRLVVALLKKVGVRVAAKSVSKYLPVIGSAVAASAGFGAMKLVGNAHVNDCYETVKRTLLAAPAAEGAAALPPGS